jgi:hypothetical protein
MNLHIRCWRNKTSCISSCSRRTCSPFSPHLQETASKLAGYTVKRIYVKLTGAATSISSVVNVYCSPIAHRSVLALNGGVQTLS